MPMDRAKVLEIHKRNIFCFENALNINVPREEQDYFEFMCNRPDKYSDATILLHLRNRYGSMYVDKYFGPLFTG